LIYSISFYEEGRYFEVWSITLCTLSSTNQACKRDGEERGREPNSRGRRGRKNSGESPIFPLKKIKKINKKNEGFNFKN
jgi:hypothetical protein